MRRQAEPPRHPYRTDRAALPINPSRPDAPTDAGVMNAQGQYAMRRDKATEKAVEIGIRLQGILGTVDAARFLSNNLVDLRVALRVLLQPSQRRRL